MVQCPDCTTFHFLWCLRIASFGAVTCSLVDLLPWECCRPYYGKVQSLQPRGVVVVVQGGYQAPWAH